MAGCRPRLLGVLPGFLPPHPSQPYPAPGQQQPRYDQVAVGLGIERVTIARAGIRKTEMIQAISTVRQRLSPRSFKARWRRQSWGRISQTKA